MSAGYEVLSWYNKSREVSPESLDSAFKKWKLDKSADRAPDKLVASGLGSLFGKYINERKKCRWVVVTDSFGTELALISNRGMEIYPINSVWKRIDPENKDINFFEPIWTTIVEKEFENNP